LVKGDWLVLLGGHMFIYVFIYAFYLIRGQSQTNCIAPLEILP